MNYVFRKIKTAFKEEYLLVFNHGEIHKPFMTLDANDIKEILQEWKKKV